MQIEPEKEGMLGLTVMEQKEEALTLRGG